MASSACRSSPASQVRPFTITVPSERSMASSKDRGTGSAWSQMSSLQSVMTFPSSSTRPYCFNRARASSAVASSPHRASSCSRMRSFWLLLLSTRPARAEVGSRPRVSTSARNSERPRLQNRFIFRSPPCHLPGPRPEGSSLRVSRREAGGRPPARLTPPRPEPGRRFPAYHYSKAGPGPACRFVGKSCRLRRAGKLALAEPPPGRYNRIESRRTSPPGAADGRQKGAGSRETG